MTRIIHTRDRGRVRLSGLVLLAGLLAASCGAGPSKVDSAAIIGSDSVPLADFQGKISKMLEHKQLARQLQRQRTLDKASRDLLTLDVQHELVNQVSARERLRPDEGLVKRQLNTPGLDQFFAGQVYDKATFVRYQRDLTKLMDLARREASGLVVRADIVDGLDPNQARELASQIRKSPGRTEQFMRAASPQAGIDQPLRPNQDAPRIVFGAEANQVLVFPSGGQDSGWTVVRTRAREHTAPSPVTDRMSLDALATLGKALLVHESRDIPVTVNPRYGTWDRYLQSVVPSDGEKWVRAYPLRADSGS